VEDTPKSEDECTVVKGVKIADLGSACWTTQHFSDRIQTREYRSPEVIVGLEYGPPTDVWSTACMAFELATGDTLFQPNGAEESTRDADHLCQMIEFVGEIPVEVYQHGKQWAEFFNQTGRLRIGSPHPSCLEERIKSKNRLSPDDAKQLADFLQPMLHLDPSQRSTARQSLQHKWLNGN